MCGWFRQVAARGREGGLGPGACLLPSHMQEDVTGQRKGPQRLRDGSALQGWGSPQGHPDARRQKSPWGSVITCAT